MNRREIVKLIAISSAIPVAQGKSFAFFRKIHATLSPTSKRKIFNPHQDSTVIAMAELIIPQTDTPGAKAARVNEFIDLIVADWYSEEDRARFLAGLEDVDARTQTRFGKTFAGATTEEQSEILHALGRQMAEEQTALQSAPIGYRGASAEPEENFYFMFRDLTLTGYFTSEIGFSQQLHDEIIPGHFDGCTPLTPLPAPKGF